MPSGVSSAGEVWPTTRRSGRLRKSRTKASRRRRFSISKNARIDEAGTLSFINDISEFGIHHKTKEAPTNESLAGNLSPARVTLGCHKCQQKMFNRPVFHEAGRTRSLTQRGYSRGLY